MKTGQIVAWRVDFLYKPTPPERWIFDREEPKWYLRQDMWVGHYDRRLKESDDHKFFRKKAEAQAFYEEKLAEWDKKRVAGKLAAGKRNHAEELYEALERIVEQIGYALADELKGPAEAALNKANPGRAK